MSTLLSRRDLSDEEVRKDAEAQLRRAEVAGEAELAQWARDWGYAALHTLESADLAVWRREQREAAQCV